MIQALELFAGMGGFAAATVGRIQSAKAIDISAAAREVYQLNLGETYDLRSIESLRSSDLEGYDLWWMSPPCQPFTRRGRGLDDRDARSQALLNLIEQLSPVRPARLAMENVPEFADSRCAARLRLMLQRSGYHWREGVLCPTQFGIPNRRQRFYLVASRVEPVAPIAAPVMFQWRPLGQWLDAWQDELRVDERQLQQYRNAMDILNIGDLGTPGVDGEPRPVSSCFTAAYGRSPVRSGSYLREPLGVRYFSVTEVARLMGWGNGLRWPTEFNKRLCWKLLGNGLSLPVVRYVLTSGLRLHERSNTC